MPELKQVVQAVCPPPFKSKLIKGDVIASLDNLLIDHRFDVVIADPPYNIGKDFGITNDSMPLDEYLKWTQQWLKRCFELLADNGVIYVYGFPEILARISAKKADFRN